MPKRKVKKAKAGIHIREIERKLFSYLFVNKVATSLQIQRDVYGKMSHQALYKRLNRLIQEGFLSANYNKELRGRLVYNLGPKALREFVLGKDSSGLRRQLKSNSIMHDLSLVDIRSRLKNLRSVHCYYSENILRSGMELPDEDDLEVLKGFNFDAVLKVQRPKGVHLFGLEYESQMKFSDRYRTKFKSIYVSGQLKAVLFICNGLPLLKKVQHMENCVLANRWPKVFYAELQNVLDQKQEVSLSNLNGEKITLS